MKKLLLSCSVLLLAGCQLTPQTEMRSSDSTGAVSIYSRYFQNDRPTIANIVIVDAIITLGKERLPKDYNPERSLNYSEGEVQAVLEVYFTNLTNKEIEIKIKNFTCREFTNQLAPLVFSIAPQKYTKSIPAVVISSNYSAFPYDYSLEFSINGESHFVKGKILRLTIDELKARQKKNGG